MFSKLPSVRELAGRIDALSADNSKHAKRYVDLTAAVKTLESQCASATQNVVAVSDRLSDMQAALEAALSRVLVLESALQSACDQYGGLAERITALEGDETPAADTGTLATNQPPVPQAEPGSGDHHTAEAAEAPQPHTAAEGAGADLADKPAPDAPELEPYRYSWNG